MCTASSSKEQASKHWERGLPQIFGECQLASAVAATLIIPRRQSGEGEGLYQEVGRRGQDRCVEEGSENRGG